MERYCPCPLELLLQWGIQPGNRHPSRCFHLKESNTKNQLQKKWQSYMGQEGDNQDSSINKKMLSTLGLVGQGEDGVTRPHKPGWVGQALEPNGGWAGVVALCWEGLPGRVWTQGWDIAPAKNTTWGGQIGIKKLWALHDPQTPVFC